MRNPFQVPTVSSEALAGPQGLALFYDTKDEAYFSAARADFVARLPRDPGAAVLEVGCGDGATGALALKHGRAGRYVGVELVGHVAETARQRLGEVVTGNIETIALPWPAASFDALILSEVLEHLIDPWATLEKLARVVRPGGLVMASSPNIAHWRVVKELIAGRFELTDRGVFDRTHMRWFTPATFADMFERAGFRVQSVGPVRPFSDKARAVSRLTRGRLDHLFMTQIELIGHRR